MQIFDRLLKWLEPSKETVESAIWTSMWVDGYTEDEIQETINSMRNEDAT